MIRICFFEIIKKKITKKKKKMKLNEFNEEPFDFSLYRDDFEYIKQKLRRTNIKHKEIGEEQRPIQNFDFSPYKSDFEFIIQQLKDERNNMQRNPT